MTTQHTQGPWKISRDGLFIETSDGVDIAQLCGSGDLTDYGASIALDERNARLIAAAPELLERVEWALKVCEGKLDDPDFDGAAENIRALLAKIQGK